MSATVPSASDPHRERAERLFHEALLLPPQDRSRFIAESCTGDTTLAAEVLSLLDHAQAGERFFGRLAEVVIPPVMSSPVRAGRFEIMGAIGAGGMGMVYKAHDTRLDRDVALKFLPVQLSAAPDAEGRLLREARAAAGLEHVNICTVYEIGETGEGWPFIAMALYEGETLKERLARGPLLIDDTVNIALQVARGLGAAHAHGIVHRDIKPGNIILTADGTVKLLDFGLATMPDSHLPPGSTPGTVPYMSPEQTRGETVGPESDLWSLGVVIYEMLTGVRPFQGESNKEVVHAICQTTPEPLRRGSDSVSSSLKRIVQRLLEKEPERRYRSADELLTDLAQELPHLTTSAGRAPLRRDSARWRVWAALGLITVAIGAAAAWSRARQQTTRSTTADGTVVASPRTLALLPFINEGGSTEDEYLSDGLTQELTRALATVRSVRVLSRTSATRLKDDRRDLRQIGRELKVSAVLAGSVQRSLGQLHIRARLVDVADGTELWSKTYDRGSTEVGSLPREIAIRIANALEAKLSPAQRDRLGRSRTRSEEALALYLKGRYFANQRTAAGYRLATRYFEQAIAADSAYGAPWAGLAAVYSQQGMSGQLSPQQAQERTRAAALRAIALDDSLAEAHVVLGIYLHAYGWDSDGAEREFRHAIELDPTYAAARFSYGLFLRSIRRLDESIAQETTAIELDPLVPAFNEALAFTLLAAGRVDEAFARVRNALELDSTYWRAHAVLGLGYEVTGRSADAIHEYKHANQLAGPAAHRTTGDLARVLAVTGREREARRLVELLQSRASRTGIYEPGVATAFFALRDQAAAYDWLEHAYQERQPELRYLVGDLRFLRMSADPRFVDLLHRLRLPR